MKIDLWGGTGRGWVLGRRRECEALDALIAEVGERQGRAMVLRGEPGIGKTALLDHVQAQADGFRVLRASGVEFETELAFAALHQLTAPLLDRRDQLPEPQREALETAFGLSAGKAADRFLVGLAMLGLLSEVAADQPLLCIIDDAQWLDQASAQALGLVGRRIAAEPVLLVFALREERPELHGLPELPISGLSEADARALLASEIHAPLDARVRDRVIGEARGNPLALLELPRSATPADLAGGFTAQPVREKIERSFLERLGLLPAQTRALMRVAAAEPVGDPVLLWRAAGSLGIPAEAVVPAQTAGLMDVGTRVRFRHPLVR